jgi:hypothetical protein
MGNWRAKKLDRSSASLCEYGRIKIEPNLHPSASPAV